MSVETPQRSSEASLGTLVAAAQSRDSGMFTEAEGKALLAAHGIDVPAGVHLELGQTCPGHLRDPLVVKAVSPTLVHKSDAGGVRVGVTSDELPRIEDEMRVSLAEAGHELLGLLVEELAPAGHEVIVGAVRSPGIGWNVMVGLGGILVEVFEDIAFGTAPINKPQIADMLGQLKGMKVLEGARGEIAANLPELIDLIHRLAGPEGLLSTLPEEVIEIDLNPIIVSETRAVAADARFLVGDAIPGPRTEVAAASDFGPLFNPRRVAVLGASGKKPNMANRYIRNLQDNGFTGTIIPIHPAAETIEGLPTAANLGAVDEPVDYAYIALPGARVAEALAAGAGKLHFAQVVSSGFGEVAEGIELEAELKATVKEAGIRLIGPNCLGTHVSAAHLSFVPEAPLTPGSTSVISQSGGLSVDILRVGAASGIDFHSVISIGNSADVSAAELVRAHLDNDEVEVIGLYLESLVIAAEVLGTLEAAPKRKPVVLLAGGRTAGGSRAASSHTGALAGNHRLWPAFARQAGITLVDSLGDFASALHALSTLDLTKPISGDDVVLFGNGGGASVLAADALDREGKATPTFPDSLVDALEGLDVPPGNGFANPIDVPAGTLAVKGGDIAEDIVGLVLEGTESAGSPAATMITHLNVGIIQRNLGASLGDVTGRIIESVARASTASATPTQQMLVLKGDGSDETAALIDDYTKRARGLGIPVFPAFEDAAIAARAVGEQHRAVTAHTAANAS